MVFHEKWKNVFIEHDIDKERQTFFFYQITLWILFLSELLRFFTTIDTEAHYDMNFKQISETYLFGMFVS